MLVFWKILWIDKIQWNGFNIYLLFWSVVCVGKRPRNFNVNHLRKLKKRIYVEGWNSPYFIKATYWMEGSCGYILIRVSFKGYLKTWFIYKRKVLALRCFGDNWVRMEVKVGTGAHRVTGLGRSLHSTTASRSLTHLLFRLKEKKSGKLLLVWRHLT